MVSSSTWNRQKAGCFAAVSYLVEKIVHWVKSFKAAPHVPLQMDPLPEDIQSVHFVEEEKPSKELQVIDTTVTDQEDLDSRLRQRNSALHSRANFVQKRLRQRADWIVFVPPNVQSKLKSIRPTCKKVY